MPEKSSDPDEQLERSLMTTWGRVSGSADRKRQFRETARDILHMAKVMSFSEENFSELMNASPQPAFTSPIHSALRRAALKVFFICPMD
jgi:hypothetical protein